MKWWWAGKIVPISDLSSGLESDSVILCINFLTCVNFSLSLHIFLSNTNESQSCNHKRCRNECSISASACQNSLGNRKCCICSLLSEMVVWAREWAVSAVFTQPRFDMCISLNHSFTYGAISCSLFSVRQGCSGCGPSSFPGIRTSHWQIILSIISFLIFWLT